MRGKVKVSLIVYKINESGINGEAHLACNVLGMQHTTHVFLIWHVFLI